MIKDSVLFLEHSKIILDLVVVVVHGMWIGGFSLRFRFRLVSICQQHICLALPTFCGEKLPEGLETWMIVVSHWNWYYWNAFLYGHNARSLLRSVGEFAGMAGNFDVRGWCFNGTIAVSSSVLRWANVAAAIVFASGSFDNKPTLLRSLSSLFGFMLVALSSEVGYETTQQDNVIST
jgi:hypothetical protein